MGKKAPKAPDPMQTAQAQAQMNRQTAIDQMTLNMVDQNNPWGSVDYQQVGMVNGVPQFSQTTTLSPAQQAIFDQAQGAQTNLATMANDQSARVAETLSNPFEFNNQDAADWAYDLAQTRIAPQQQQTETAMRDRLINQGIRPGTTAWDSEMARMTQGFNDQNNQLALTGRNQAFAEAMATRNQPLNELSAMLSGSQVSNPAQMSSPTPQTGVGGVDYAGLVQNDYNNRMQQYNSQMGGMFGLLGQVGGAAIMASDVRLKTDIARVGMLDNGLPVYSYRYKAGGPIHIGVMAQDVEKVNPDAVVEIGGLKGVDYARAVA